MSTLPEGQHHNQLNWFRTEVMGRGPGRVTFAIIKPDATPEQIERILQEITDHGLSILTSERRVLSMVDIQALYWVHCGKPFYDRNAAFLNSGPSLLLALEGYGAVGAWRQVVMPKIREELLDQENPGPQHQNLVHGSDNVENAFRELHYFFRK